MHRYTMRVTSAALAAFALAALPAGAQDVAVPAGAQDAGSASAPAWILQCRSDRTTVEDCGLVGGVVDAKDAARWLKAAIQFDEAGELRLVLKTFPLPLRKEGAALLVDGRQVGSLAIDGCDPAACRSTTTLPRPWAMSMLSGREAEVQVPTGGDVGAQFPLALKGIQAGVAALRARLVSSMSGAPRRRFDAASTWTTIQRPGATFFVASDRLGFEVSTFASPARETAGLASTCRSGKGTLRLMPVVIAPKDGETLSADDLLKLENLRADAKACDGQVYVLMPPARDLRQATGSVPSLPGLQTYIEDHGIASIPAR